MSGTRKLNDKYYARIRYKKNGKRKEKLINLKTKSKKRAQELNKEIEKQEHNFKQGLINIDEIEVKEPTNIEKLIDKFYKYLKVSGKDIKTIELYRMALETFQEIVKGKNIEGLDYTDFLGDMKQRYPHNTTCNIRLTSIKSFLNWLVENNEIEQLPFKIKKLPVKNKKPRYFSDQEMKKILDEAKHKILYARIYVHWKTGMRLREISDSYFKNNRIYTSKAKKNGVERSIPIDQETRKQYEIAKESDLNPDYISLLFTKLLKKLDLYTTRYGDTRHFHNLRHTFAVRTYYKTRDIFHVKKVLGHSSVATTEIYADFELDEISCDFNIIRGDEKPNKDKTLNDDNKPADTRRNAPNQSNYKGYAIV